MKHILNYTFLLVFGCSLSVKEHKVNNNNNNVISNEFNSYWYQGKAEITHFKIQQARYGEVRKGYAVLIYVTEDFLTNKQVKKEKDNQSPYTPVLKLNYIKRFVTGIYDYSMFTSVFTPVLQDDFPNTLKVTLSSQDWCGQVFLQFNLMRNKYSIKRYSYFEDESDETYQVEKTFLEDEIWTKLRINPSLLPVGNVKIIPGSMVSRFLHFKPVPTTAVVKLIEDGDKQMIYEVYYPSMNRTLRIFFTKNFPYSIEGWEEIYKDGFGDKAKTLVSKGEKVKTLMLDYWTKNTLADSLLRNQLEIK